MNLPRKSTSHQLLRKTGTFRPNILLHVLILLCSVTGAGRLQADDFTPLVNGLSMITQGAPGAVFGVDPGWVAVVGGDDDSSQPSTLVIARTYGKGRVVILGHDGMLSDGFLAQLDNGKLMTNTVSWLQGTNRPTAIFTTGHGEWASGLPLQRFLTSPQFAISAISTPINQSKLAQGSVLIVGNAWGDFTSDEINAVTNFVSAGGGLLMAGLGWSWDAYHPGKSMEEYPMMRMAAPYGGRWLKQGISDASNQTNGAPVFHTFYPSAVACTPLGAMFVISNTHAAYGASLLSALETNVPLRTAFVSAHESLAVPSFEFPATDPMRATVYDFCLSLLRNWPVAYTRTKPIDQARYPTSVWIRERLWRTTHDCYSLTPERRVALADAAQLVGASRALLLDFGIALLDNCRLETNQLTHLHTLLTLIPPQLHDLRAISVADFLGTPPIQVPLSGSGYSVNTFGSAISNGPIENQFPADVAAGNNRIFCSAAAHEVNHIVDAHTVGWSAASALANRRAQLISDAGTDNLNYLRSGTDGFFVGAPQEFFASIANQWFTDTDKVFDLAQVRFRAGRTQPINQALFFAEVYSRGGGFTYFYKADLSGNLLRRVVPLHRNDQGLVDGLQLGNIFYRFSLNLSNNVTSYTVTLTTPPSLDLSVTNVAIQLTWSELPLGYSLESCSSLSSKTWLPKTNLAFLTNGRNVVTLPRGGAAEFFRLANGTTSR